MTRLRWNAVGGVALLGLLLALCAPADAAVQRASGITYVERQFSPADGERRVKVRCPRRLHVLSGGVISLGAFTTTTLRHSFPFDSRDRGSKPDDGWIVTFANDGAPRYDGWAVCAKRRVRYVVRSLAVDSASQTNLIVPCPSGTSPTGGGHRGGPALAQNSGFAIPGQWAMFLDNYANEALPVTGYAVCVRFEVEITSQGATVVGPAKSGNNADCPPGTRPVGGGQSNGAGWQEFRVSSTAPLAFGDSAPHGWVVFVDSYTTDSRSLTAQAICSAPLN